MSARTRAVALLAAVVLAACAAAAALLPRAAFASEDGTYTVSADGTLFTLGSTGETLWCLNPHKDMPSSEGTGGYTLEADASAQTVADLLYSSDDPSSQYQDIVKILYYKDAWAQSTGRDEDTFFRTAVQDAIWYVSSGEAGFLTDDVNSLLGYVADQEVPSGVELDVYVSPDDGHQSLAVLRSSSEDSASSSADSTEDAVEESPSDSADSSEDAASSSADSTEDTASSSADSSEDAASSSADSTEDAVEESPSDSADSSEDTASSSADSSEDSASGSSDSVEEASSSSAASSSSRESAALSQLPKTADPIDPVGALCLAGAGAALCAGALVLVARRRVA